MKTFISWSGGKDSAFALFRARAEGIEVSALLTSINATYDRISMHGVRRSLLELQAASLGMDLYTVELSEQPSMNEYEQALTTALDHLKTDGYSRVIYGDIFLQDLKDYRDAMSKKAALTPVYPLWSMNTKELVQQFFSAGFKAIVACVHSSFLPQEFCGREIDASFLNDLPPGVDPCGENGEFHSFVYDGPIFSKPVPVERGSIVYREYEAPGNQSSLDTANAAGKVGFHFCDLLPATGLTTLPAK